MAAVLTGSIGYIKPCLPLPRLSTIAAHERVVRESKDRLVRQKNWGFLCLLSLCSRNAYASGNASYISLALSEYFGRTRADAARLANTAPPGNPSLLANAALSADDSIMILRFQCLTQAYQEWASAI